MMSRRIAVLFAAAVLTGCASSGSTSQPATSSSQPRHSANVITQDELATVQEGDLYSAIQRLRPNFLMTRGVTSINHATGIVVYLDNSRLGDVSSLRQLTSTDVKEVRYFSASEATQRYGTGTPNGAILVIRK